VPNLSVTHSQLSLLICPHLLEIVASFRAEVVKYIMCSVNVILCTATQHYSFVNFVLCQRRPLGHCADTRCVYFSTNELLLTAEFYNVVL